MSIHLLDAVAHHHDDRAVAGKVTVLSDQSVNLICGSICFQRVIQMSIGSKAILLNQRVNLIRSSISLQRVIHPTCHAGFHTVAHMLQHSIHAVGQNGTVSHDAFGQYHAVS